MPFFKKKSFGGSGAGDAFIPWHIISGQTVTVPTRREMALHGELFIESGGVLILQGTARLRVQN